MAKKNSEKVSNEEIEKNTKAAMRDIALDYGPFVIVLIFVIVIRLFICSPVRVDGSSMDTTLSDGQILLLYKLKVHTKGINRFDIVVINSESDGEIIKRVIGLPGEFIKYVIEEKDGITKGVLYVNNKVVEEIGPSDEAKLQTCKFNGDICKDGIQLGENEYFVMGDNRPVSKDSRIIGPINKSRIQGITEIRLFPFSKFGSIKK